MKQINPLYLILLSVALLIFVLFRLGEAKKVQSDLRAEIRQVEQMGERIEALKSSWDESSSIKKEIQRLLKSAPLRESQIDHKLKGNTVELKGSSLSADTLSYLLNKLLNGSYTIKQLEVKRVDAESASLRVEVAL